MTSTHRPVSPKVDAAITRWQERPQTLPEPKRCAYCGEPVPDCATTLADGQQFCSLAHYDAWLRR